MESKIHNFKASISVESVECSFLSKDLENKYISDSVTAISIHEKIVVFGTELGFIRITDHLGNLITSVKKTKSPVSSISIDSSADFILYACDDYNQIFSIDVASLKHSVYLEFSRQITAFCINPQFSKRGMRNVIVCFGQKVVIAQKSWLNEKQSVIHISEAKNTTVKWFSRFASWANQLGCDIFDIELNEWIGHVQFNDSKLINYSNTSYGIYWKDKTTLLIYYGSLIKICVIQTRSRVESHPLPQHIVELHHEISVGMDISGASHFNSHIMAIERISGKSENIYDTEFNTVIFKLGSDRSYHRVFTQKLDVTPCSYSSLQTDSSRIDRIFFLSCDNKIFKIKKKTLSDLLKELLATENYEEAYKLVQAKPKKVSKNDSKLIGIKYLYDVVNKYELSKAYEICIEILSQNKDDWEKFIKLVQEKDSLAKFVDLIPNNKDLTLSPQTYTYVLCSLADDDHALLFKYVAEWPFNTYYPEKVIEKIESNTKINISSPDAYRAQAYLYSISECFSKGLDIYIMLNDPNVFDVINQNEMFSDAKPYISDLININLQKTIRLLVDHSDVFKPVEIIKKFRSNEEFCETYLSELYFRFPNLAQEFADFQLELYVKLSPVKVLPFVREASGYNIRAAIDMCSLYNLNMEEAFLYEKSGDHQKALEIYVSVLEELELAILLCEKVDHSELWNYLIKLCLGDSKKICKLLADINSNINPISLIKSIPHGKEVPGIKDAILTYYQNYSTKISLMNSCHSIINSDNLDLLRIKLRMLCTGLEVGVNSLCRICKGTIIFEEIYQCHSAYLFSCKHYYHVECLKRMFGDNPTCIDCKGKADLSFSPL